MTYPTPPGPRIAYDVDGSTAFYFTAGGVREAVPAWLKALNSDASNEAGLQNGLWQTWPSLNTDQAPVEAWFAIRLPVATRIRAFAAQVWWGEVNRHYRLSTTLETSSDSTNGQDGTWGPLYNYISNQDDFRVASGSASAPPAEQNNMMSYYHELAQTGSLPFHRLRRVFEDRRESYDLKGYGWHPAVGDGTRQVYWVRLRVTGLGSNMIAGTQLNPSQARATMKLHLYGEPDTTASNDRLQYVDSGGVDKFIFDFGDVTASEVLTQTFAVKNLSADDAEGVQVAILVPNPALSIPGPETWCKMSTNGVTWSDIIGPFDLAAGDTSDMITLRVSPLPDILGPWSPRLRTTVEEWV